MTHDETAPPSDSDEARNRSAAADWIERKSEGESAGGDKTSGDIDGLITPDDASNPPDPDAYGTAERDTLAVEDHAPASREYPRPDPHGGITEADRRL